MYELLGFFGMPGQVELVVICLVVLLLFGAKRIPDIAQGLGKGIREFRGAIQDTKEQMNRAMEMPDLKSGKLSGGAKDSSKPKPGSDSDEPSEQS